MPLSKQAQLPLPAPEVVLVEASDQAGLDLIAAEAEDVCLDADELQGALQAFADGPEEADVRQ